MKTKARYLLDTNVISEARRGGNADPRVSSLLRKAGTPSLFLSVLTLGELRKGALQQKGRNPGFAQRLSLWIDTTEQEFASRLLPVDLPTARTWAELSSTRTRPVIDSLLAATALVHDLTLVTRNTKDVADTGVKLLNPWLA